MNDTSKKNLATLYHVSPKGNPSARLIRTGAGLIDGDDVICTVTVELP